jgi:phosphomannomutase
MINVSPIGRNCSLTERDAYEVYDLANNIRPLFVEALKKEFPDFGMTSRSNL